MICGSANAPVADSPSIRGRRSAVARIATFAAGYFAWRAIVEPVLIRWIDPEDWHEEAEIIECKSDYPWCAEGWRVTFEDR